MTGTEVPRLDHDMICVRLGFRTFSWLSLLPIGLALYFVAQLDAFWKFYTSCGDTFKDVYWDRASVPIGTCVPPLQDSFLLKLSDERFASSMPKRN